MNTTDGSRFSCDGCGRSYSWKPELAGKRVKCKCGNVLTVSREPPAGTDDQDALYALAEVEQQAAKNQPVTVVAAPITPAPAKRAPAKPKSQSAGVPLAYRNAPTAREKERMSNATLMDMKRDVYVPAALFVVGMLIYVGYYAFRYQLGGTGIALTALGLGIMTAFKAAMLIGFALVVAGPLGVSFGGPATAALKLAALAVFTDGVITWVDAGTAKLAGTSGGFEGLLSFPIALGAYWLLLIYLFSMDPGDSWMVVILLAVFDFIVRWVILLLLLKIVLSWGGAAAVNVPSFGGNGAPASASPVVTRVTELKESKALEEARAFIADGHQAVFKESVDAWYAAGCPNVWFSVSRDFNGKRDPGGVIVELPKNKAKRAKCYEILKAVYQKLGHTGIGDEKDTGEPYMEVELQ